MVVSIETSMNRTTNMQRNKKKLNDKTMSILKRNCCEILVNVDQCATWIKF